MKWVIIFSDAVILKNYFNGFHCNIIMNIIMFVITIMARMLAGMVKYLSSGTRLASQVSPAGQT